MGKISRIFGVMINVICDDEKMLREIASKYNPRYVSQIGFERFQVCFFSAADLAAFKKCFE